MKSPTFKKLEVRKKQKFIHKTEKILKHSKFELSEQLLQVSFSEEKNDFWQLLRPLWKAWRLLIHVHFLQSSLENDNL